MAKRNKKGGWTGSSVGSGALKSGGGPQVEKQRSESKKFDAKYSGFERVGRIVVFILVCVLAGSPIYQATPKNMAEYWELDKAKESIVRVEIVTYAEDGTEQVEELTDAEDIEAFYTALDETSLRRKWFAGGAVDEQFTGLICVYLEGETEASYEVGFVNERVYFIGMPTYDWYLNEAEPIMEYLK